MRDDQTERSTAGRYLGECRLLYNILEQWDGRRWRRVPDVLIRESGPPARIHFDVEDALREAEDPVDLAFRPRI